MSDEIETIDKNPKSWAAWKREAERLQAIIDDMALAAMDSEPVKRVNADQMHHVCLEANRHLDKYGAMAKEVNKLLGRIPAQPAPVVLDETQSRAAFEKWCSVNIERNKWHPEFYAHLPAREQWAAWEACRSAMLASVPTSIPIISDRWIPVSERMPEDRTQVILWDAEIGEVTSGHYSHKTHTFYHCGDAIENEITHWMAPPAAPQEVSDA
ncbi:TPA: DUF551 domain-containing protein [Klebsiella michiganensis]|nr:DUF551 domain-containing protein [Klebsiella michiganensis]